MSQPSPGVGPKSRSRFIQFSARVLPVLVLIATLGVIAWTAWPTLRPVREVRVTQAIFDPSASEPAPRRETGAAQPAGPVVQAAGWLEAEPFHVACTSLVDGVVESIHVLEGDYVEKDEVVAQLVREDEELRLRIAEARVETAQGELEIAQAELAAASANWEDPVELDRRVETSRAAVAETEGELAQLPKLIASARADLERLTAELKWIEVTESGGAATELEVVVATQNVEAARNHLEALQAREPIIRARLDQHRAQLRAAERDLTLRIDDQRAVASAKANVQRARAAHARAEAERDEAALALERTTIRAPISGYVERRLKIPGDKVMLAMDEPHSAHIVHLYDPERLQVRVDVPLADAAHVRVGQACEIIVEVLPNKAFMGEVLRITHQADLQKNTLEIKVKVKDPDPLLKPEMLTRVKFLSRDAGDERASGTVANTSSNAVAASVLVPAEALDQSTPEGRVWVVADRRGSRGQLRAVRVSSLGEEDGWVRVSGTLHPGALLAVVEEGFTDGLPIAIDASDEETGS